MDVETINAILLNVSQQAKVRSLRFGDDPMALLIVNVAGTNGRRLSIQPFDQGNSTASSQLEIVPGANVDPREVTTQILLYNKTGENFERFVTSAYNGEYQFHSSRRNFGKARPTFFYMDNVPVTAWMQDATFRVYKQLDFFNQLTRAVIGSIRALSGGGVEVIDRLKVTGAFGVNGAHPEPPATLPPTATDMASTLTLVNAMREALIATGIAKSSTPV